MAGPVYIHSWTYIENHNAAWKAFAAASAGGGSPAVWTESDDPERAVPPPDAAGRLWRAGCTEELPHSVWELKQTMENDVFENCELTALAAYFSCGGQGVFLLAAGDGSGDGRYVVIARPEDTPRHGAREGNLVHEGHTPEMLETPLPCVGEVLITH